MEPYQGDLIMPPIPPPIRRIPVPRELTPEVAKTAIETIKNALSFFTAGMPIIHHTSQWH